MNSMKFVIHNPHALWFKENLSCFFAKTKSIKKYDYIIDYLYNSSDKVYVYIDGTYSSPLFSNLFAFLNLPIIEFYAWVFLNKLNPFKFKLVKIDTLSNNDVFFSFLYSSVIHVDKEIDNSLLLKIRDIDAFKVFHLSHFGYKAKLGSRLCKEAKIDLFVSESNLSKNSDFFKLYYNWYNKDVLSIPFMFQNRFKNIKNFDSRINKVLSTGTNTLRMKDSEFIDFFHSDLLQPMREVINSNSYENYIDSLVNNISINDKPNISLLKPNIFKQFFRFIFADIYRIISLGLKGAFNFEIGRFNNESNYYKIDIVEKYNEYKMFIVPEEIIGVPGIGFVEGMSCGCAYFGVEHRMYSDLGLISGVHYVGYNGTIKDLLDKISYYQINSNELKLIAKNGSDFVTDNFNYQAVSSSFFNGIKSYLK